MTASPSLKDIRNLYYTALQAREVLGLDEDEFQDWIGAGWINRYVFPPRKRGLYLKSEIDSLAEKMAAEMIAVAIQAQQEEGSASLEQGIVYRQATLADLPAENDLSEVVFGS